MQTISDVNDPLNKMIKIIFFCFNDRNSHFLKPQYFYLLYLNLVLRNLVLHLFEIKKISDLINR